MVAEEEAVAVVPKAILSLQQVVPTDPTVDGLTEVVVVVLVVLPMLVLMPGISVTIQEPLR